MFLSIFYPRSPIVDNVFDCRLSGVSSPASRGSDKQLVQLGTYVNTRQLTENKC